MSIFARRSVGYALLTVTVAATVGGQALAGPVFDLVSPPVGIGGSPDGPQVTITLTPDDGSSGVAPKAMTFNNTMGNLVTPLPGLSRFSETLTDGLDTASADGDVSYLQSSTVSGYAVASYPSLMGVGQTRAGGTFGGASELDVDFDLKFDVDATGWNGPLFVYQLFVLSYNLTAPGDSATFNADFTYTLDDGVNPPIVEELSLFDSRTFGDGKSPTSILFDYDLLTVDPISSGTIYRIEGNVNYSSTDDEHAMVGLSNELVGGTLPPKLLGEFEFVGLPQQLWNNHGGGAFVGNPAAIPEPSAITMLVGLSAAALARRRR